MQQDDSESIASANVDEEYVKRNNTWSTVRNADNLIVDELNWIWAHFGFYVPRSQQDPLCKVGHSKIKY